MSELFEKLRKRRSEVDQEGLHFESKPLNLSGLPTASASSKEGDSVVGQTPRDVRKIPTGGGDFQSIISQRRTHVDGDGQTFESCPKEKTADCSSDRRKAPADIGRFCGSSQSGDFRQVIDKQRARVDAGAGTWESTPSGDKADSRNDIGQNIYPRQQPGAIPRTSAASVDADEVPAGPATEALPTPTRASASSQGIAAAPAPAPAAEPEEPPATQAEEAKQEAAHEEEAPAAEEATAAFDEDEDGEDEHMVRIAEAAEAQAEEAAAAAAAGGGDGEEPSESAAVPRGPLTPEQVMNIKGNRITWLVELAKPLPTVFESPRFKIGNYDNVIMKLYPNVVDGSDRHSTGCTLVLHGPDPRPAGLHALLFAGKGWRGKLHSWPEGQDMTAKFELNLSRHYLLCGLVFGQA